MCDEELWDRATAESWLLPLSSHFLLDPKQGFDVHVAWSHVVTKMLPVLSYEKIRRVAREHDRSLPLPAAHMSFCFVNLDISFFYILSLF